MAELMAQHPGKLALVKDAPNSLGDGHRRVFGIAPRSKGIGGFLRNDVDLGHRQAGLDSELANDAEEFRILVVRNLLGVVHLENNLVAEPITEEIHPAGHYQSDYSSLGTAEHLADPHHQGRQGRQQYRGAKTIHLIASL